MVNGSSFPITPAVFTPHQVSNHTSRFYSPLSPAVFMSLHYISQAQRRGERVGGHPSALLVYTGTYNTQYMHVTATYNAHNIKQQNKVPECARICMFIISMFIPGYTFVLLW